MMASQVEIGPAALELVYQSCKMIIGFMVPIDMVALRENLRGRTGERLTLDAGGSNDTALLLRSTSGHTQFRIQAEEAALVTRYSEAYAAPGKEGAALREAYAIDKFADVVDLLALAGAQVSLFGAAVVARMSPSEADIARVRAAATAAFALNPLFAEGDDAFDFVVRASRAIGEHAFSNVQVGWYQERSIEFRLTPEQVATRTISFKEWDATLTAQGLELTYDRNNKKGLFAGKRTWSTDDLKGLLQGTLDGSTPAFVAVQDAMLSALKGAD